MQNTLARVVSGTKRFDHIKPTLRELHWLPVVERIDYKVALITHKVLQTNQPPYLKNLISEYGPSRRLRSDNKRQLVKPSGLLTVMGSRSFTRASERVWNNLTEDIRLSDSINSFKSKLKTHLFKRAIS